MKPRCVQFGKGRLEVWCPPGRMSIVEYRDGPHVFLRKLEPGAHTIYGSDLHVVRLEQLGRRSWGYWLVVATVFGLAAVAWALGW